MRLTTLFSALLLLPAAPAAAAQGAPGSTLVWGFGPADPIGYSATIQPAAGQLTGTVLNAATDGPLRAAQVFLQGTTRAALTAADGSFAISNLQPATYTVVVQRIGYQPERIPVRVRADSPVRLEIRLSEEDVAAFRIAEAWAPADPADSLYRAGREALNRGDFSRAVGAFGQIHQRYPDSAYAGDALYWEAFARQRLGGEAQLRAAVAALDAQRERYPTAATRRDAETLSMRLRGLQAELGDANARLQVLRAAAVESAASVGAAASVTRVTPSAFGVRGSCDDESHGVRTAALHALVRIEAAQALDAIEELLALHDDCSLSLRENALLLASRIDDPAALSLLRRAALGDPSPRLRESALMTLSRAGEAGDLPVRMLLGDSVMRVRSTALTLYLRTAEPGDYARLYSQLEDRQLRQTLVFTAARSDLPEAGRWLRALAADATEPIETRRDAVAMFARNASVGEAITFFDQLDDPRLREPVLLALGQRASDGAAFEKLVEVARSDPDARLRQAAVLHLSRSDDPRVARVLRELSTP